MAQRLGEATGTLVGPTVRLGQAQHHLAFPGTVTLRPSTFIAVVIDYAASLARHGFERLFVLNAHGGNIAPLQTAFAEIGAQASLAGTPSRVRLRLVSWWEPRPVRELTRELYGGANGSHAAASEIAVTQHLLPATAKPQILEPRQAPAGPIPGDALAFRRSFPDGRIGSEPSLATPEHGRLLLEAAVTGLAGTLREFLDEP